MRAAASFNVALVDIPAGHVVFAQPEAWRTRTSVSPIFIVADMATSSIVFKTLVYVNTLSPYDVIENLEVGNVMIIIVEIIVRDVENPAIGTFTLVRARKVYTQVATPAIVFQALVNILAL